MPGQSILALPDEYFVQVGIGISQPKLSHAACKCDLVCIGANGNGASEKLLDSSRRRAARMDNGHADGADVTIRQAAADPHQGRHPEFHLVPVHMPRNAGKVDTDPYRCPGHAAHHDAFGGDGAVPFCPSQSVAESLGGGENEIEQFDPSEIELPGEVKSEEVIPQRVRSQIQEPDLPVRRQPSIGIVNPRRCDSRLVEKGCRMTP
jgi:hypothetical protein